MAGGRKIQALKKQRIGAVRHRADAVQTTASKPILSVRPAPAEMPTDKPIALSAEQMQYLTERRYAQVYGEPIAAEAVSEILKAVGTKHIPHDLDVEQLKTDIYTAWRFYSDWQRWTSKGQRTRLRTYVKKVRNAVHDLEEILNQQNWEADVFRCSRLSSEVFPLNSFRIQLQFLSRLVAAFESLYSENATPLAQRAALGLTATEWLFGWCLPNTFEKHFKQKADRSRQEGESVDSPYIRFAIAFAKSHGWKKLSPETISSAMTKAKTRLGGSTKKAGLKISRDWHFDSHGNLTRVLENF